MTTKKPSRDMQLAKATILRNIGDIRFTEESNENKIKIKELLNTKVKFNQIYFLIILWGGAMFSYLVDIRFLNRYLIFIFLGNIAFMLLNWMENNKK